MTRETRDPYRDWSYADRREAQHDPEQREAVRQYDRDAESSDRAYDSYRSGGEYSDPDRDGRFH